MTDDHGVENEDDVKKKDLDLLKQKGHWDQFHHENTRCVRRAVWPLARASVSVSHFLLFSPGGPAITSRAALSVTPLWRWALPTHRRKRWLGACTLSWRR